MLYLLACIGQELVQLRYIVNKKFTDYNTFVLWHYRLGHPGSIMMRRIIENSNGHPLKDLKVLLNGEFSCTACYQGKLIVRPSPMKVKIESPAFLKRNMGIFVDLFTHLMGHLDILWF